MATDGSRNQSSVKSKTTSAAAGLGSMSAHHTSSITTATATRRYHEKTVENLMDLGDLELIKDTFWEEGCGYNDRLSVDREQFAMVLSIVLKKGSQSQYADLFDKIDSTRDGCVDWDMIANYLLLEFYGKDDRKRSTQIPKWQTTRFLQTPHHDVIQRVLFSKNLNRYIALSREGTIGMWDTRHCRLQRTIKITSDFVKPKDLWATDMAILKNVNKMAVGFNSKEIAIYDLSSKLDFNCQYRVTNLPACPLCLDYWYNETRPNEAVLSFGDTQGNVHSMFFILATIALFEKPNTVTAGSSEAEEQTVSVKLEDLIRGKDKNVTVGSHAEHKDWVRQVLYSPTLECIISSCTKDAGAMVLAWQGRKKGKLKTTSFSIFEGINAFDYDDKMNIIATAGVNKNVCLWNPYVISKSVGVLRGHMTSILQVQFNKPKGHLLSISKDNVVRVWDIQQQICLQRLAGMFPKKPDDMQVCLYFHEEQRRMFATFNYQLTLTQMLPDSEFRVNSHDKPIQCAIYNRTFNQIITADQSGEVSFWMLDTGQKAKKFNNCHGKADITNLALGQSETTLYTASTDGTVKAWNLNGGCFMVMKAEEGNPAELLQVLTLKRSVLAVGWRKTICAFETVAETKTELLPYPWKGGEEHNEDILCAAFSGPITLATGGYDGEIVVWNVNSEHATKHLTKRMKPKAKDSNGKSRGQSRMSIVSLDGRRNSSPDDTNDFAYAITNMLFLETRKYDKSMANLVTCGGNGWVRFWNTNAKSLDGEWIAHPDVTSIIMAVDDLNHNLITADVDGYIKVWNISEYCITDNQELAKEAPPLVIGWWAHSDTITSILTFVRNHRHLVITCGMDQTCQVWGIEGSHIGTFGQEDLWRIEPYVPPPTPPDAIEEESEDDDVEGVKEGYDNEYVIPDNQVYIPGYKHNTWEKTKLGMEYAVIRVDKRERQQPGYIKDMPYLHWEETGQPPGGPYASVDVHPLEEPVAPEKPGFVTNPYQYFRKPEDDWKYGEPKTGPIVPFDERNLFPRYILEREAKMREKHKEELRELSSAMEKKGSTYKGSSSRSLMTSRRIGRVSQTRLNSSSSSATGTGTTLTRKLSSQVGAN